jgi:hypothetical protein
MPTLSLTARPKRLPAPSPRQASPQVDAVLTAFIEAEGSRLFDAQDKTKCWQGMAMAGARLNLISTAD